MCSHMGISCHAMLGGGTGECGGAPLFSGENPAWRGHEGKGMDVSASRSGSWWRCFLRVSFLPLMRFQRSLW